MNQTNADRADTALRALESEYDGLDQIVDLLSDLRHLAHSRGINFGDALATANNHFWAELKGEE